MINKIVIATTLEKEALKICTEARNNCIDYFQGDNENVLERFYQCAAKYNPEWVVRVTADCPLLDWKIVDKVILMAIDANADYCSNTLVESFPDGQDVEVFRFDTLRKAREEAYKPSDREHVTPYIKRNSNFYSPFAIFKATAVTSDANFGHIRMTVDEPNDFELIKTLVENVGDDAPMEMYVNFLLQNEAVFQLNNHIKRNEGYLKSLKNESSIYKIEPLSKQSS